MENNPTGESQPEDVSYQNNQTQESQPEETSKEEYKDPEYTLVNVVDSGTCGYSAKWELDENGLLVISGSGNMENYNEASRAPWFSKRESIKTIIVKKGITSIGEYAFWLCENVTGIAIPDSVTTIGMLAIASCNGLVSITVPDSVTSIGLCAFGGKNISDITVDKDNVWYSSLDGILYNKNGTELVYCPRAKTESFVIPDNVTSIKSGAFIDSSLTSVSIPESVTIMENTVFGDWGPSQTIYIKGRSEAPSGWKSAWNRGCYAKIVWNN